MFLGSKQQSSWGQLCSALHKTLLYYYCRRRCCFGPQSSGVGTREQDREGGVTWTSGGVQLAGAQHAFLLTSTDGEQKIWSWGFVRPPLLAHQFLCSPRPVSLGSCGPSASGNGLSVARHHRLGNCVPLESRCWLHSTAVPGVTSTRIPGSPSTQVATEHLGLWMKRKKKKQKSYCKFS